MNDLTGCLRGGGEIFYYLDLADCPATKISLLKRPQAGNLNLFAKLHNISSEIFQPKKLLINHLNFYLKKILVGVKGVAFDVGKLHEINCGGQFPFGLNQLPVIGEKAEIKYDPHLWSLHLFGILIKFYPYSHQI